MEDNNSHQQAIPQRLLLFDGLCNLCDRSVQFIIRHDPKGRFKFAALQSGYAQKVLRRYPDADSINREGQNTQLRTIVFILKGKEYLRSTAILKVMHELGWPWRILTVFYLLPKGFRDRLYNYIAGHRYKWYGKKESCMIPTPELRNRFMDAEN